MVSGMSDALVLMSPNTPVPNGRKDGKVKGIRKIWWPKIETQQGSGKKEMAKNRRNLKSTFQREIK